MFYSINWKFKLVFEWKTHHKYTQLWDTSLYQVYKVSQKYCYQRSASIFSGHGKFSWQSPWNKKQDTLGKNSKISGRISKLEKLQTLTLTFFFYTVGLCTLQTLIFSSTITGTIDGYPWIWIAHQLYLIILACNFASELIWNSNHFNHYEMSFPHIFHFPFFNMGKFSLAYLYFPFSSTEQQKLQNFKNECSFAWKILFHFPFDDQNPFMSKWFSFPLHIMRSKKIVSMLLIQTLYSLEQLWDGFVNFWTIY